MAARDEERVHLLGIRHHGPGSAKLLCQALDALNPACVLVEGPPEGDALIPYVDSGLQPPVAILLYAADEPEHAMFMPFAEFSPEWQALQWALRHHRPVRFIDWPAAVSLAATKERLTAEAPEPAPPPQPDPLDLLAGAAGYEDGEGFWNSLIEQSGSGQAAIKVFASIEQAMTEARSAQPGSDAGDIQRNTHREAFMRLNLRAALKAFTGEIAVVCGAWHVSALRSLPAAAADRALVKDLPRLKVESTWVPWTDSRLSAHSGYGAGVLSPGWYRHLWSLYARPQPPSPEEFAAAWQARTAFLLREQGYLAPAASAIEASRLALGLAALRELPLPGLAEMREASLATMCHGNPVPLAIVERKLYVGERVGEIGARVPQNPLARDLALWQRKTRLKPQDLEQELKLDLRTEAGLLKSTLLHRLQLLGVNWGQLVEVQASRGTFREVWLLHWDPSYSVSLAEAVIHGVTIEQAAGNATLQKARQSKAMTEIAGLIQGALLADLPETATACIGLLQAAAVTSSDLTDLMHVVAPLAEVLRYGTARKLPEEALRSLILSISVEINAGLRMGSRNLDEEATAARLAAMEAHDEALRLFGDEALSRGWSAELGHIVRDDKATPAIAGVCLRRLHDRRDWDVDTVAAEFSRHTGSREPKEAGPFLEAFLRGRAEVLLQDDALLPLLDAWLIGLAEDDFTDLLPLLRRGLSGLDSVSRRRILEKLRRPAGDRPLTSVPASSEDGPFEAALPLLYKILGMGGGA